MDLSQSGLWYVIYRVDIYISQVSVALYSCLWLWYRSCMWSTHVDQRIYGRWHGHLAAQ